MDEASIDGFSASDDTRLECLEDYDFRGAKLKASISWILTKAYGCEIPPHIRISGTIQSIQVGVDRVTDDCSARHCQDKWQIMPPLVNLMTSSELYCLACSRMFPDTSWQWQGHCSIIQVLSRKGIYVIDAGGDVVTETILMHTAPFKVTAHLALVDALMLAYAREIASVEVVVHAVRRYVIFSASDELPSDVEEALLFWVNKTCQASSSRDDDQGDGRSGQKIAGDDNKPVVIPQLKDFSELGDGRQLVATIAFYHPNSFQMPGACLANGSGLDGSGRNLSLIRTFCQRHLVMECFHFTREDLFYGHTGFRVNVVVFLAELFLLLEASTADRAEDGLHGDGHRDSQVQMSPRHGLRGHGAIKPLGQDFLCSHRFRTDRFPGTRSSPPGCLLENVSASWDADAVNPIPDTILGTTKTETISDFPQHNVRTPCPRSHERSETGVLAREHHQSPKPGWRGIPLSAVQHPLRKGVGTCPKAGKKDCTSHRKTHLRVQGREGDGAQLTAVVLSSRHDKQISMEGGVGGSSLQGAPVPPFVSPVCREKDNRSVVAGDASQRKSLASQSSVDVQSNRVEISAVKLSSDCNSTAHPQCSSGPCNNFHGDTWSETVESNSVSFNVAARDVTIGHEGGEIPESDMPGRPSSSYTLSSSVCSSQAARKVGLPVIDRADSVSLLNEHFPDTALDNQADGLSCGSSGNCGSLDKEESLVIHQHLKGCDPQRLPSCNPDMGSLSLLLQTLPDTEKNSFHKDAMTGRSAHIQPMRGTTSFAELRRLREASTANGSRHMDMLGACGRSARSACNPTHSADGGRGPALNVCKLDNDGGLPEATCSPEVSKSGLVNNNDVDGLPLHGNEFSQLRLKLEEKRRNIERNRRRHEVTTAKMRQRLGNAAFMRVIDKPDTGGRSISEVNHVPLDGVTGGGGQVEARHICDSKSSIVVGHVTSTLCSPAHAAGAVTFAPASSCVTEQSCGRPSSVPRPDGMQTEHVISQSSRLKSRDTGTPVHGVVDCRDESVVPVAKSPHLDTFRQSPSVSTMAADCVLGATGLQSRAASLPLSLTSELTETSFHEDGHLSMVLLNTDLVDLQGGIGRLSVQYHENTRGAAGCCSATTRPSQPKRTNARIATAPMATSAVGFDDSVSGRNAAHRHAFTSPSVAPHPVIPSPSVAPHPVIPSPSVAPHPVIPSPSVAPHPVIPSPSVAPHPVIPSNVEPAPPAAVLRRSSAVQAVPGGNSAAEDGDSLLMAFGDSLPQPSGPRAVCPNSDVNDSPLDDVAAGDGSCSLVNLSGTAPWADAGSSHSGSHQSLQSGSDDSSSGLRYVLGQEVDCALKQSEQGMLRRKERLILQQRRRKEDQDRRRHEKVTEARLTEELRTVQLEEEVRRKTEEKAHKEAIFKQYLQKKNGPSMPESSGVMRRERMSVCHQRPKSMFASPMLAIPDLRGGSPYAAEHLGASPDAGVLAGSRRGSAEPRTHGPGHHCSGAMMRRSGSYNQITLNGGEAVSVVRRPPSPTAHRPTSPRKSRRPSSPGMKLFVRPSAKSNRHIIVNALSYCCLAGVVNSDVKNRVLEEIAQSTAKHFLILFRDQGCQYRGSYIFDPDREEAYRIIGVGPRVINSEMAEKFYKYNSGQKSFSEVSSTKHLSVSIDAIVLFNSYWKLRSSSAIRR